MTCTPARGRRRQRQDRGADIAAELRVHARRRGEVRDQRRCRRFAVGAGDGDERRAGRALCPLAAEQFDIADHLDAGLLRQRHRPVRFRMRERNAGRQHQRRDLRPIDLPQIGGGNAGGVRFGDARGIVIEGDDVGAAGEQRAGARKPRAAQPEHRDLLAGKTRDRDHEGATSVSGSTVPPARARPRRSRSE